MGYYIRNTRKINRIKILLYVIIFTVAFSVFARKSSNTPTTFRSEYYTGIAFRETPYADIVGVRPVSKEKANGICHFQMDYDQQNRLVQVQYLLNGKLKPFSDRFVRSSRIKIEYSGNEEIRTFYNEFGHRTLVSGDVYTVKITLDENGNRTSLNFYDVNENHIENDFGIASYEWNTNLDGTVIEKRYDIHGNIQRNRPGFGYFITKFTYDHRGFLSLMTNLGKEGNKITTDKAGVAHTKIGYDLNGYFIQWQNLDPNYNPKRGMSNIAEIQYIPSLFNEHLSAAFIDANSKPQVTNWGAHMVKYTFDEKGNVTSSRFYGIDGNPVNTNNGIGFIKRDYSPDGRFEASRSYFDKDENPIHVNSTQIHQTKTEFENGNPIRISYLDLNGALVTNPSLGYASEVRTYDDKGRLTVIHFLTEKGKLTNHATWGIARFVYNYKNKTELASVNYYDATGKQKRAVWNPVH